MMQQWFLDLDGVRSGPYQTPEVLSLIAEGEVLPHHRIAQGLKAPHWISILDWRLEQAQQQSSDYKAPVEPTPTPPIEEKPAEMMPPPLLATPSAPSAPPSSPPPQQTIVQPPKKAESKKEELFIPAAKTTSSSETNADDGAKPARDPMAEMFDLLQNSKQKREAKSQQQAQQTFSPSSAATTTPAKSSGGLSKTLGIGLLIVIVGFALGQLFQSSEPPASKTESAKTKPTPSASASPHLAEGSPAASTDRSTDKMTIRNHNEKPAASANTIQVISNGQSKTLDKKPNDRELEELKSLKTELQELKNLKEEVKDLPEIDDNDATVNSNPINNEDAEGAAWNNEAQPPAGQLLNNTGNNGEIPPPPPTPEVHY